MRVGVHRSAGPRRKPASPAQAGSSNPSGQAMLRGLIKVVLTPQVDELGTELPGPRNSVTSLGAGAMSFEGIDLGGTTDRSIGSPKKTAAEWLDELRELPLTRSGVDPPLPLSFDSPVSSSGKPITDRRSLNAVHIFPCSLSLHFLTWYLDCDVVPLWAKF